MNYKMDVKTLDGINDRATKNGKIPLELRTHVWYAQTYLSARIPFLLFNADRDYQEASTIAHYFKRNASNILHIYSSLAHDIDNLPTVFGLLSIADRSINDACKIFGLWAKENLQYDKTGGQKCTLGVDLELVCGCETPDLHDATPEACPKLTMTRTKKARK